MATDCAAVNTISDSSTWSNDELNLIISPPAAFKNAVMRASLSATIISVI